jgi:hypothetical protein
VSSASRVRGILPAFATAGAFALLTVPTVAYQTASPARRPANAQATALQTFEMRLKAYVDLRSSLARQQRPLSPTPSPAELTRRQQSLAAAIKAERATAKRGDVIPAVVAAQIVTTIRADLKTRSASDERATFAEVPNAPTPAINQTYPADALATVPPLILTNLPRLPDNLQYRFYGRHMLLLDADAQIIVDYIPNVLPPH